MRGYFGIGIEHSKTEQNIGTLFRSAVVFGASFIFTVGRRYRRQCSDTTKGYRHMPLFHFAEIGDLLWHLPYGCPLIGIELHEEATMLKDYAHRERACYLLGAEDHGLTGEAIDACHELIILPGRFCLNVATAGSIVMYDRHVKEAI